MDHNNPKNNKFLFDLNVFDARGRNIASRSNEKNTKKSPAPARTYSQEDYDLAVSNAYDKGQSALRGEHAETAKSNIETQLKQIKAQIDVLIIAENDRNRAFEQDSIRLLHDCVTKVFPHLLKKHGPDIVSDKLKSALTYDIGRPDLTVNVPQVMHTDIENHIKEINSDAAITVKADADLTETACSVTWNTGGYDLDLTKVLNRIEAILSELLEESNETLHDKESNLEEEPLSEE